MGSGLSLLRKRKPDASTSHLATDTIREPASLAIDTPAIVTPRNGPSEMIANALDSYKSVPYTPYGDEANVYKYYCPLCMQHFDKTMKTKCCANYMCRRCFYEYVQTKKQNLALSSSTIEDILDSPLLSEITCPHCITQGFHLDTVGDDENVRDYSRSAIAFSIPPSPVRVGESFDDLKRKMVPFKRSERDNDDTKEVQEIQQTQVQEYSHICTNNNINVINNNDNDDDNNNNNNNNNNIVAANFVATTIESAITTTASKYTSTT